MIQLALGLVHNRGNLANRQQIANLLPIVISHFEQTGTGSDGEPIGSWWYSLQNLTLEHRVKFYQVIPFSVNPPNNLYDLDSYKVFYGAGDEDKTGEHCRFFNWLLKRGTDYGAEVVLYLRSPALFGAIDLDTRLRAMEADRVFLEPLWGKIGALRLLREVGQLRENRVFDLAVDDLKVRITARGLRYG